MARGPKTTEGRARCAAARTMHGRETRAIREERKRIVARLRYIEEEMFRLGLIHGPRTRGRKPSLDGRFVVLD